MVFRFKQTYCKSCSLHHNVEKNVHKELPPRDTGGTTAQTSDKEVSQYHVNTVTTRFISQSWEKLPEMEHFVTMLVPLRS